MAVLALALALVIGAPASETLAGVLLGPCGAGVASHDHAAGSGIASHDHAAGHGCQHEPAKAPASKDCLQMPGCMVLPASAIAEPAASAAPVRAAVAVPAGFARLAGRNIPPDISPPIARI